MRRFVCLYLPRWPLQRLLQEQPELRGRGVALYERTAQGPRLTACSLEATQAGLTRHMLLADARALAGQTVFLEAAPCADHAALERLALWCERFSPLVGLAASAEAPAPSALFLDVSGCERLFRGEANLLRLMGEALTCRNLRGRTALASALGAAWALAHFGTKDSIVSDRPEELLTALAPLPLPALRLDGEARVWLCKLGLHHIGELLRQPRSSLPSRFGPGILTRLDQAFGDAPETFVPLRPPPEIEGGHVFEYSVKTLTPVLQASAQLLEELVAELERRGRGARELECWLFHEAGDPLRVNLNLFKGTVSKKHLLQLLRTRLEDAFTLRRPRQFRPRGREVRLQREEGVCGVSLRVLSSETLNPEQLALFAGAPQASNNTLAITLDRIGVHLGPGRTWRAKPVADAQPETACALEPFVTGDSGAPAAEGLREDAAARPLRLFPQPRPLTVEFSEEALPRRVCFEDGTVVALCALHGPERIESGWWKPDGGARRDYFVLETANGARHWIFRDLDSGRWYLHGVFS